MADENNTAEDAEVEEEGSASDDSTAGNITSPDGVITFVIAGIFDLIGLIPVANIAAAILALIYFFCWMLATNKKGFWKLFLTFILMVIPVESDIAVAAGLIGVVLGVKIPTCWIGLAYSVIMSNGTT